MATSSLYQELQAILNKQIDRSAKIANDHAKNRARNKIVEVANNVVDNFYSFGPDYYNRTGALRDYEVGEDDGGFYVDFNQQISTHQDNDLVLDLVVEQGYHGGSPGAGAVGVMYRGPLPKPDKNGELHGWFNWTRGAEKGSPILKDINEQIDIIEGSISDQTFQIFADNFGTSF